MTILLSEVNQMLDEYSAKWRLGHALLDDLEKKNILHVHYVDVLANVLMIKAKWKCSWWLNKLWHWNGSLSMCSLKPRKVAKKWNLKSPFFFSFMPFRCKYFVYFFSFHWRLLYDLQSTIILLFLFQFYIFSIAFKSLKPCLISGCIGIKNKNLTDNNFSIKCLYVFIFIFQPVRRLIIYEGFFSYFILSVFDFV